MLSSSDIDREIGESDPIRKFIVLVLWMAHEDGATALVLGTPQLDGNVTLIRFKISDVWHDLPPFPKPVPSVATELEPMAGLSQAVTESILERTVAGVTMRWRVRRTVPSAEYLLTPIAD